MLRIANEALTFDDVTNLISAQRTAAWADIARRIAHEIKNPLTPIQLSAERLQAQADALGATSYGQYLHRILEFGSVG